MHDCFGKRINPFDPVRAATREELDLQGHVHDAPLTLSPAEQFAFPSSFMSETCNVYVSPRYGFSPTQPLAGGVVEMKVHLDTTSFPTLCNARQLVKL